MDVREKGHRLERKVATMLRSIGYDKAKTTRANNKTMDACGVDIDNVPFYIQCKAGYKRGLNYTKVFEYMRSKLMKELGKIDKPLMIIHQRDRSKYENLVVVEQGNYYVVMAYDDFIKTLLPKDDISRTARTESIRTETTDIQPSRVFSKRKKASSKEDAL